MKLKPLNDRVLAKRKKTITETESGLLLPDDSQKKQEEATIVAVGQGYLLENGELVTLELKVGDNVLFSKFSGTEIIINNEEYLIFQEKDILGVIYE